MDKFGVQEAIPSNSIKTLEVTRPRALEENRSEIRHDGEVRPITELFHTSRSESKIVLTITYSTLSVLHGFKDSAKGSFEPNESIVKVVCHSVLENNIV